MSVVLTYGSLQVHLPSPAFENEETVEFDRINRKTRGGDLIVFRDPEWTEVISMKLKFVSITERQKNSLLQLIQESLGKQITLRDWEGYTWVGIITNPNNEAVQAGRTGITAQLEFQGQTI